MEVNIVSNFIYSTERYFIAILRPPTYRNDLDLLLPCDQDRIVWLRVDDCKIWFCRSHPGKQVRIPRLVIIGQFELQVLCSLACLLARLDRGQDGTDSNRLVQAIDSFDQIVWNNEHRRAIPLTAILSKIGVHVLAVRSALPLEAETLGACTIQAFLDPLGDLEVGADGVNL